MKYILTVISLFSFTIVSCQTGKIHVLADINRDIKEVLAIETTTNSPLLWVIEDAGNKAEVFGLNINGGIEKTIKIKNVQNKDWEDLTSDFHGNLYIGDFGNNNGKRRAFSILKVSDINTIKSVTEASIIDFRLPKGMKSKDFEAFFLWNGNFYIFSKERKKAVVVKVPNIIGTHRATVVAHYYLKGKETRVTSADISEDGKTIVLLNHGRVWKLTDFKDKKFFKGTIEELILEDKTQKEGVCFKTDSIVYITDERNKSEGGNIYTFRLH